MKRVDVAIIGVSGMFPGAQNVDENGGTMELIDNKFRPKLELESDESIGSSTVRMKPGTSG